MVRSKTHLEIQRTGLSPARRDDGAHSRRHRITHAAKQVLSRKWLCRHRVRRGHCGLDACALDAQYNFGASLARTGERSWRHSSTASACVLLNWLVRCFADSNPKSKTHRLKPVLLSSL